MRKRIFVICNSAAALSIICGGDLFDDPDILNHGVDRVDLSKEDIFTCNSAYGFFRTEGRHYNMIVDPEDIERRVLYPERLCDGYEKNIGFIYSPWDMGFKTIPKRFPLLRFVTDELACSSGLNAAVHSLRLGYTCVRMVGYTRAFRDKEKDFWDFIEKEFKPCRVIHDSTGSLIYMKT